MVRCRRPWWVLGYVIALFLLLALPCFAQSDAAKSQSSETPVAQKASIANFVDIADKAGLKFTNTFGGKYTKKYIIETTGTGVAIFDFDNDGWPDLFFVNGTTLEGPKKGEKPPTNHLYHNNRDGTFTDVTEKAGVALTGWGQGTCVGDYDNDGNEDLYVTYYGKNHLLRNNGDGTFADVTDKGGVGGTGRSWGAGCAWVDYDRDGLLDLVISTYVDFEVSTAPSPGETPLCIWKGVAVMCGPRGLKPSRNILYHNLGNGKFEDVTAKAHIDNTPGHYCLSVSPFDFDNDGWPDIYVACDSTPSILYRNNHDGTFTDVAIVAGAAYNEDGRAQAGMGSAVADYDGDGKLDIFKTNFSDDTSSLYKNNGDGTFTDATFAAGFGLNTQYLGWGAMFFDFDNDGWPDILLVNGHVYPEVDAHKLGSTYNEPRILYRNRGDGTFVDISVKSGPGITGMVSSRGLAVGDLWNDGKMSAVVSNMNAPPSLLVNQVKSANHWVGIKAVGTKSNRSGIGARITLKAGSRTFVDEVRSGSSYYSNSDMRVHFGLGSQNKLSSVEIRWPSGLTEQFDGMKVDAINTVKEGSGKAVSSSSPNASAPATLPKSR